MPWELIDFDPGQKGAPSNAAPQPEPAYEPGPSGWAGFASTFTGAGRTEYPEASEFQFTRKEPQEAWGVSLSAIAPGETDQLGILKKYIPQMQTNRDRYGNLMLKTPEMKEWAYLNKPGLSSRDLDELVAPAIAAAPFLGWAYGGKSLASRLGRLTFGLGASKIVREAVANTMGSGQNAADSEQNAIGPLGLPAESGGAPPKTRIIQKNGKTYMKDVDGNMFQWEP